MGALTPRRSVWARPSRPAAPAGHAFGLVEDALRQAQLDRAQIECLAIGLGPGSYNGMRLAIAVAQGWQLASP